MFTKTEIDRMEYRGGKDIRWAREPKGFGVRVHASGSKSYIYRLRENGRDRTRVIGQTHKMSPSQALKVALDYQTGKKSFDETKAVTLGAFAEVFIERRRTAIKAADQEEYVIRKAILPRLKTRLLSEIKRVDVARLAADMVKTPNFANRVVGVISIIFEKAIVWGYLPDDHLNPARRVERYPENKRERFVTESEMPYVLAAIESEPLGVKAALWLYLSTGLRRSEVMTLKWESTDPENPEPVVDLAKAVALIPKTKNGTPHQVPIAPVVVRSLEALKVSRKNNFVFGSLTQRDVTPRIREFWKRVRFRAEAMAKADGKEINLSTVRIHDLRHTVASMMVQAGVPIYTVSKVLNHSSTSMTQRYAHLQSEHLRGAVEQQVEKLISLNALPSKNET